MVHPSRGGVATEPGSSLSPRAKTRGPVFSDNASGHCHSRAGGNPLLREKSPPKKLLCNFLWLVTNSPEVSFRARQVPPTCPQARTRSDTFTKSRSDKYIQSVESLPVVGPCLRRGDNAGGFVERQDWIPQVFARDDQRGRGDKKGAGVTGAIDISTRKAHSYIPDLVYWLCQGRGVSVRGRCPHLPARSNTSRHFHHQSRSDMYIQSVESLPVVGPCLRRGDRSDGPVHKEYKYPGADEDVCRPQEFSHTHFPHQSTVDRGGRGVGMSTHFRHIGLTVLLQNHHQIDPSYLRICKTNPIPCNWLCDFLVPRNREYAGATV